MVVVQQCDSRATTTPSNDVHHLDDGTIKMHWSGNQRKNFWLEKGEKCG